jgi:hypothetical protein
VLVPCSLTHVRPRHHPQHIHTGASEGQPQALGLLETMTVSGECLCLCFVLVVDRSIGPGRVAACTAPTPHTCPNKTPLWTHHLSPTHSTHTPKCTAVKASKEEMDKNQVDLALRDACAHLLIPLNKCVREPRHACIHLHCFDWFDRGDGEEEDGLVGSCYLPRTAIQSVC